MAGEVAFFDKKEKRGGQGCDERLKCALENQGGQGEVWQKRNIFRYGLGDFGSGGFQKRFGEFGGFQRLSRALLPRRRSRIRAVQLDGQQSGQFEYHADGKRRAIILFRHFVGRQSGDVL